MESLAAETEPIEAPVAATYRVRVPENVSLLGALVAALLENSHPERTVEIVESADDFMRMNDVLVEDLGTGRKLAVFGTPPDRALVAKHLADGVFSLVGIDSSRTELLAALASLERGPAFISPSVVRALAFDEVAVPAVEKLTEREREVLRLLVDGPSNREIAERLFLSPNTVRSHLQSISSKLGISSRAKLAAYGRSCEP